MSDLVLVTGGLGYVGGRVSAALLGDPRYGLRATALRQSAAPPSWLPSERLIQLDLKNDEQVRAACAGITSIVHLAALNENVCAEDPEQAFLVNTLGTLKLIREATRAGVKRFIYFSTAHVYGAPLRGTISEQSVTRPAHPYAYTHRAAEDLVLSAHDRKQLTGIVLRLSNGFGAPTHGTVDRWTLLANDLCRQAVTTRRLVLRSSGLQRRDFITLADVAMAVRHFLSLDRGTCADGLFNLGGEQSLRVIDLTEMIAGRCLSVLGFTPAIDRPAPRPDETAADLDYRIDKLKDTGFTLRGNMQSEIDATLRLCREQFGAAP